MQLHFCTFSVIVSLAPHFHRIVRFRTLRQNRERYNPPHYDRCPSPHAGLGTECTHTGFRQLSGILWRTNLEICNFYCFSLVAFVIGHSHSVRTLFPIVRTIRFVTSEGVKPSCRKFKLLFSGSLIFHNFVLIHVGKRGRYARLHDLYRT